MKTPSSSQAAIPVVMAGVVPPPVHGQSLATRALFEADLSPIEKHLVEICSSKKLDEVGKASVGKAMGLFLIFFRILKVRFRSGAQVLYYTAGSASAVPFVRDLVLLGLARPFFRSTVIHYHSGGLPDYLRASRLRGTLGRWIYGRGAWAISLSGRTEVPGLSWGAGREVEVPNGLDVGETSKTHSPRQADDRELRLLFIGNLYEDKGVFELLAAAKQAAARLPFVIRLILVGSWPDEAGSRRFEEEVSDLPANLRVDRPAPRYGDEKWQALADADLFVFPTYYRSENLPLVIIEAMACGLPVIAADWRGVGSLVSDNVTGILVPPRDVESLTAAIVRLAVRPDLRHSMGEQAKHEYRKKFTAAAHIAAMKNLLLAAALPD